MINPEIEVLTNHLLLDSASRISQRGFLALSANKLLYLKVDDDYIHDLYPLLQSEVIQKPDYFRNKRAGAHISVMYPSEGLFAFTNQLGGEHIFQITEFVAAKIGHRIYYALMVECPGLSLIRKQLHLTDKLNFKGYAIGFHITIGVRDILV